MLRLQLRNDGPGRSIAAAVPRRAGLRGQIAQRLTGRPDLAEARESFLSPILKKLQPRRNDGRRAAG